MTYDKPEVAVLGDASRVIQGQGKIGDPGDGTLVDVPAYDLDD